MRPRSLFYWLVLVGLTLDQLTKYWAENFLQPRGMIEVIPHFFHFTYVRNTGIAFGLFGGNNYLWLGIAILLLGVGFWMARKFDWQKLETNLLGGLLLTGAIGNLTDRIWHGYVIDFLDFNLGFYRWPVFNVADSCITISVVWILWRTFLFAPRVSS